MSVEMKPIGNRVLIEMEPLQETTASGLSLPKSVMESRNKLREGDVIAVGDGRATMTGDIIPMQVKEGSRVLFDPSKGVVVQEGKNGSPDVILFEEIDLYCILR